MKHAFVLAAALAAVSIATTAAQAPPGRQTYAPPKTAAGQPDLQGIWQVLNNAAEWNLEPHAASWGVPAGLGIIVDPADGMIPYQPAALATRAANFKNRETADPLAKCYKPGVPRLTYLPFPLQIIQSPQQVTIFYEYVHNYRNIHLNRKTHLDGIDFWNGDSIGHWEGNTLVVDVANFNGQTWLDRAGNFHSEALHLTERFTLMTPDVIQYEVTIEDPKVFTRPWRIAMPLYRRMEPNFQLLEYRCTEFAEEFLYGHVRKEQLVKRWEGETMIVDITRKVPPGDKLYEWYRR